MLLTQIDNVVELLQQDTLSGHCPVATAVVCGLSELTVLSQRGMEDGQWNKAVRLTIQLKAELPSVDH